MYVLQVGSASAGFADIELDRPAREAAIAYYIAPEYRGIGLGSVLLSLIEAEVTNVASGFQILASVATDNAASSRMLQSAGYIASPEHESNDLTDYRKQL